MLVLCWGILASGTTADRAGEASAPKVGRRVRALEPLTAARRWLLTVCQASGAGPCPSAPWAWLGGVRGTEDAGLGGLWLTLESQPAGVTGSCQACGSLGALGADGSRAAPSCHRCVGIVGPEASTSRPRAARPACPRHGPFQGRRAPASAARAGLTPQSSRRLGCRLEASATVCRSYFLS